MSFKGERKPGHQEKGIVGPDKKESLIYGQPIYNLQVKYMNKTTWNGIDETRPSEYEKMIDGSSKFRCWNAAATVLPSLVVR